MSFLLLESGDYALLESGEKIILDFSRKSVLIWLFFLDDDDQ